MQTLRTPDDRFADLPGYDFSPHYADVADGEEGGTLRVHYLREGDPRRRSCSCCTASRRGRTSTAK
jgi:hypothetical protein